ncbi:zinc dependent phospholipase C family protein [Clostridium cadaveris]|uniref:zinc dependent phospholipase C family protein n=1 Tax=Clostridium cadaveris TaxID=1529 RepID=UPI000C078B12|nr:zinc dependent phospholipase C family protein [Clostridium cadaveris]UFH64115.1 zinc dependent phospholipase C family protein [Clostridium cadaveris]
MLVNTHKLIGNMLLDQLDLNKYEMLKSNSFLWGNIKPDCASKYKFKKHYQEESFEMITKKIEFLSSLTLDDLGYVYNIGKFNQELGVICHFLCDFFCVPHYERWEFKSADATKRHIIYERELNKYSKDYRFKSETFNDFKIDDIDTFLLSFLDEYKEEQDYRNDLSYAYFICYNVLNSILSNVVRNSKNRKYITILGCTATKKFNIAY